MKIKPPKHSLLATGAMAVETATNDCCSQKKPVHWQTSWLQRPVGVSSTAGDGVQPEIKLKICLK